MASVNDRYVRRAVVHVALLALLKSPDADGLEPGAGRQISDASEP